MNQGRRAFLGTASILSAWGLVQIVTGCSAPNDKLEPTQPTPNPGNGSRTTPPPTDDDEFVTNKPAETPPVEAQPGNAEWAAKAKDLESKNVGGVAYTQEAPGPFAGKERSHVPVMTVQSDGVAVIVVNHVMDAGFNGDAGADASAADSGAKTDAGKTDAAADAGYVDSGIRPTHYISTIWVMDDQNRVIFMKELVPTDPSPPFIALRIPEATKTLRAYEHCNLHGVWASGVMTAG